MKNLRDLLSEHALPYYIHQDFIDSKHPLNSEAEQAHRVYEAAQILVSERHEKSELIDLVNALLRLANDEYES